MISERDDHRLVDAYVRDRSERAFKDLYDRHTAGMFAIALRVLGGRGRDAEDVVQEAWIRAASGLARFRWESSLRTWLCGITINCARARFREPLFLSGLPEPGLPAPTSADTMDLEQALSDLPPGYRTVLVLHDIEGYTHREIAGLLDIEEGTAKSQLSRARAAMRTRLSSRRE